MNPLEMRSLRLLMILLAAGLIPACGGTLSPDSSGSSSSLSFSGVASATPSGTPGDVVLTWTPAIDTSGTSVTYNVYYAVGVLPDDSGKETLQFSTTNPTGVTVSGLTSKDPYVFLVQAQDGAGNAAGSSEVAATAP